MKFFVVPHQHFDLIWRRDTAWYQERRRELYDQALGLLAKQPELKFTFSQMASLRQYVARFPQRLEEIRELLQAGRLEFIGASLSIPDVNMTTAAAQLMNCAAGKQWFKDTFGMDVPVGAFEDAFGVPAQTPQLMRLAGYEVYKAGRMPRPGRDDVGGDFMWQALDGSMIRCIGNGPAGMSWGWGFSQNPDEVLPDILEERYERIREEFAASLEASLATGLEYTLFTVMGEEQSIFPELPRLVDDLRKEYASRGVEIAFSTFREYYESLPQGYWERVPVVAEDLSRIFTGCYTGRIASKLAPRRLEYRILTAQAAGTTVSPEDMEHLALLQFHDAICGCHIDENARYLATLAQQSQARLAAVPGLIPVAPQLPDWSLSATATAGTGVTAAPLRLGHWEFAFAARGQLADCRFRGVSHGPMAQVMCREEHGTMWTEEYGPGVLLVDPTLETVESMRCDGNVLEVTTSYFDNRFRNFWPGLARLRYRKQLTFAAASPWVRVNIQLDILGNSTEVAVRWGGDENLWRDCRAEIPLGSVARSGYERYLIQGDAFPALNFVAGAGAGVLNSGTPGHALRDGHLETLLLRSPVKRWAPWFPVTPTEMMWDNGPQRYQLVYGAENPGRMAEWHRAGMEFNGRLAAPEAVCEIPDELAGMPDNLVPMSFIRTGTNVEAVIVEVEGGIAAWRGEKFRPREAKRMVWHV